jgi:hypothetical protein
MAYTLAQYNAISSAIASGVTSVSYEGKTTNFASLDILLRVQSIIGNALGLTPATASSTIVVAHDRGYGGYSDASGLLDSDLYQGW